MSNCNKQGEELQEYVSRRLKETNSKMYGASWCGFCEKQKEEFGSFVSNINYVECGGTQASSECSKVSAFPSWKINNQEYQGYRELKSLCKIVDNV